MHLDDILKSPMFKKEVSVEVKDVNLNDLAKEYQKNAESKTVVITINRTVKVQDSDSTYAVKVEQKFGSPEELKEMLEAVGYFEQRSITQKVKRMAERLVYGGKKR
jgi:hypothetical protein